MKSAIETIMPIKASDVQIAAITPMAKRNPQSNGSYCLPFFFCVFGLGFSTIRMDCYSKAVGRDNEGLDSAAAFVTEGRLENKSVALRASQFVAPIAVASFQLLLSSFSSSVWGRRMISYAIDLLIQVFD